MSRRRFVSALTEARERKAAALGTLCEVFVMCDRPATVLIDAGRLGTVPACERCAARYEALGGGE